MRLERTMTKNNYKKHVKDASNVCKMTRLLP